MVSEEVKLEEEGQKRDVTRPPRGPCEVRTLTVIRLNLAWEESNEGQ